MRTRVKGLRSHSDHVARSTRQTCEVLVTGVFVADSVQFAAEMCSRVTIFRLAINVAMGFALQRQTAIRAGCSRRLLVHEPLHNLRGCRIIKLCRLNQVDEF
jgi:hypothetical protein